MTKENQNIGIHKKKPKKRSLFRVLGYVILFLILFVFLISILIQVPFIQNIIVDKVAKNSSKKLNTEVTVGNVAWSITKGLVIKDFLVKDSLQDTLIYSKHLSTSLQSNLSSLFNKEFSFDRISLDKARINIITREGETKSNLVSILSKLNTTKKEKKENSKPANFMFDGISLRDSKVTISDEHTGAYSSYLSEEAEIDIESLDLEQNIFVINSVFLKSPEIILIKGKPTRVITNHDVEEEIRKESVVHQIFVNQLQIEDGFIQNKSGQNTRIKQSYFDKDNFQIENIDLTILNAHIGTNGSLSASLKNLTGKVNNRVSLNQFKCDSLAVHQNGIELLNFGFKASRSTFSQQLMVSFDSFDDLKDHIENVNINSRIEVLDVAINDILYFAPGLADSPFFKNNQGSKLKINGIISGNTNNLKGRNLQLTLGDETTFKGSIDGKNLSSKGEESFALNIEELNTSILDLRKIIPGFNLPENFNKLGKVNYLGSIVGSFNAFDIQGALQTDIGASDLDAAFDLSDGIDNLRYSGFVNLQQFDLGLWTDNPDFKTVDITANVQEGSGLRKHNAKAKLDAKLNSFFYKDYEYKDLDLKGQLNVNEFNGSFNIDDENANIAFDGYIKDINGTPKYQFTSDIKRIDFQALNLFDEQLSVEGDFNLDFTGSELRNMIGDGVVQNLIINKNDTTYILDSVAIHSAALENGDMEFNVRSSAIDADVKGEFDLTKIPQTFIKILKENYPYHTRNIVIKETKSETEDYKYTFDFNIKNTNNLLELAGVENLTIEKTRINGNLDSKNDEFNINMKSPAFTFGNYKLFNVEAVLENSDSNGYAEIKIDTSYISNRAILPINIVTLTEEDTIYFDISTRQQLDSLSNIDIIGQLIPHSKGYEVNVEKNSLYLLGRNWIIDPRNQIAFGDNFIKLDNLRLTDGSRGILIDDIDQNGLNIDLIDFDLDLLNPIIDYDKMLFSGVGNVYVKVHNLFEGQQYIESEIEVPDFRINDDEFGEFIVQLTKPGEENRLDVNISIKKDSQQVSIEGDYELDQQYLDVDIDMANYPMSIFEYIIPEGISDTKGGVDITAHIEGVVPDLKLQGDALIKDGATKVDYLGTYFTFDNQRITLDEKYIDASQVQITDVKGNVAQLTGGLNHDFFKDFRLALNISSDNFIGLNTTKRDNPLYYGLGEGKFDVDFTGAFDAANILVDAITGPTSHLSFPITETQVNFDESFIKFRAKEDTITPGTSFAEEFKLLGLNFEMNLEITNDADVRIIFDESVGEVMEGYGTGNVTVFIKRSGEFEVYGDYDIDGGEYLFSAYGISAKRFKVNDGGILRWTGDPFDANLDVEAIYTGVRTPLTTFLAEYLQTASPNVANDAQNRTPVELKLLLDGTLYNPNVNFDIKFPEVTGELKSYTDSKMRTLGATDGGINNQVVGLLIFNTFLPYNNPLANLTGANLAAAGSTTVTEFITSQFSILLTEAIQQTLGEDSFIQGVDVNIALNENTNIFGDIENDGAFVPDEVDVNTRYRFKNDDFALNLRGNYVWDPATVGNVGSYVIGDVILDYYITNDRRLKFQIYSKFDYDEIGTNRKYKNGFGISYRTEFGTLSEFVDEVVEEVEEVKAKELLNSSGNK